MSNNPSPPNAATPSINNAYDPRRPNKVTR